MATLIAAHAPHAALPRLRAPALRGDHYAYLAGLAAAAAGLAGFLPGATVFAGVGALSGAQFNVLNLFAGYLTVAATLGGAGRLALRGLALYSAAVVLAVAALA